MVALDVVETLFSLDGLTEAFRRAGLSGDEVRPWFARFLRDAMALEIAGVYRPFREVAAASLEAARAGRGLGPDPEAIDRILRAFAALPPHPDVAPALKELKDARVRTLALTNGGAETTRRLFEAAGLGDTLERVLSVDEVGHWKPARAVYLHAAAVCGEEPRDMALVAAHAWDVLGAARAGWTTGWVARGGESFPSSMDPPTVRGASLVEVVHALVGLPPG